MSATKFPFPGSPKTKRITTGRAYFIPTGGVETDLGNVVKFQRTDKRDSTQHYASKAGVRQVDAEVVHTVMFGYRFTLDEYTDELAALLQSSAPVGVSGNTVVSAPSSPFTITHVQLNKVYNLGGVGLTSVVVTDTTASSTLVNGLDYIVDLVAGRIQFLGSGNVTGGDGVSTGDAISVAITGGGWTKRSYASATLPTVLGSFVFYETDQNGAEPRAVHTCGSVSIVVGQESEEQTTGFRTVDITVTCLVAPTVDEVSRQQ
jgi:hypothetical protein